MLVRDAVMNAHSFSANAAYDAALQKRRAFACRPRFPCSSEPQRVIGETLLIRLKLLPTDVADMNIRNHELPFRPGNLGRAVLAVRQKAACGHDRRRRRPHSEGYATPGGCESAPPRTQCNSPLFNPLRMRRGNRRPCSRNSFAVCIADPVLSKVSKTRRIAACTSAVRIENQRHRRRDKPDRWAAASRSSPRRALLIIPPLILALRKCSSASDMVPFNPSRSLSLKFAGS